MGINADPAMWVSHMLASANTPAVRLIFATPWSKGLMLSGTRGLSVRVAILVSSLKVLPAIL